MSRDEIDLYSLPESWWSETAKMIDEGYEKFWAKRGGKPMRGDFEFGKSEKNRDDEENESRSS